jgi:Zn-dependent protease with chaperone function
MIPALALIMYALTVGVLGIPLLLRARWPERAPLLGVLAWQILSVSVLGALLLAGLSVAVPAAAFSVDLADLLHACVNAMRTHYAGPGAAVVQTVGAAAVIGLLGRVAYLFLQGLRAGRRARSNHLAEVRLLAQPDNRLGALVFDHPSAAAYCLPGRCEVIILTSGAVVALDEKELQAVIAHERAHLRGRHHLVLAAADALARTLLFLPNLSRARAEQARLLEMMADDAAARRSSRLTVARALVRLAEVPVPVTALGASNVASFARMQRLLEPSQPVCLARRTFIALALMVTASVPLLIAFVPVFADARLGLCPFPMM